MADLEHTESCAFYLLEQIPHILTFKDVRIFLAEVLQCVLYIQRVKILQMFIERDKEKESNEYSTSRYQMKNYYEIHRTNLFGVRRRSQHCPVEVIVRIQDAFRSLQNASSATWKNTIRISFINPQGLAEAGIDQNGIFKEFIQEAIRQAFDPSFNLFRVITNRFFDISFSFVGHR